MGMIDKFLNAMKLSPDDDDEFYNDDYYDDEDYEEEKPKKKSTKKEKEREKETVNDILDYEDKKAKQQARFTSKVTPMRPSKKQGTGMEVCVIKPTNVEDAREITETLLLGRTVVLNVEGLDVDIAQRIIDFTSGSCFAIDGNLQTISNYIFLVTPPNVDISGDVANLIGGGFDVPPIQTDL